MLLHAAERLAEEVRSRLFDWTHQVETHGEIAHDLACVADDAPANARARTAAHVTRLHRLFASLGASHERFTFVAIGCGKGRSLLVASEYPFGRIVGVEPDAQLHDIASRNVQRYRSRTQRCREVECLHRDPLQFPFPTGPLVLLLSASLRAPVLVPLLRNLQASYARQPRAIVLLDASPFHVEHVMAETMLRPAPDMPHVAAFRTPEEAPAVAESARTVA